MKPSLLQAFVPESSGVILRAGLQLKATRALLRFEIEDPQGHIEWPSPNFTPKRQQDLWKRTCFELFLRDPGSGLYWEWNLSPCGNWGTYAFASYRKPLPSRGSQGLSAVRLEGWGGVTYLEAEIDLSFSPLLAHLALLKAPLEFQLAATLEDQNQAGKLSYWAEHHTGPRADFHAAEAFQSYPH